MPLRYSPSGLRPRAATPAGSRLSSLLEAIKPWLARIAAIGIAGYPLQVQRRLKILNVVSYLIAFFTFAYAVQHIFVDVRLWAPVIVINLLLAVVALLVPLAHRFNEIAGGLVLAAAEFAALFVLTGYLGHSSGIHIQYITYAAAPFVILGLGRLKLILSLVITGFVLHLASWFLFPDHRAFLSVNAANLDAMYITASVTTFGLIAATVYYAFHLAERAEAQTDALLRNILPETIVDRLKASPDATIADTFEEASVLFADLQGFVTLAKKLGPARTVEFLNTLMTEFDRLAVRHGVEKIKTIGDAYMAAAGVPNAVPDHAQRLARLSLDLLAAAERASQAIGEPLALRIGLASGPLMGGVIGAKRLTYDVWGDTVNLASRLEGSGEPGRVHVSAHAKALLEHEFGLEGRGARNIRGFGTEHTWYLVRPAEAARSPVAEEVDAIPAHP
ncbi:MAG: adenylate/guanylate cyclase domain-containing protein [Rhodospirillales bacterium]|nr:adenylate/guanylate cyclase domain-containing protein [Rhodospirillales bacterium]